MSLLFHTKSQKSEPLGVLGQLINDNLGLVARGVLLLEVLDQVGVCDILFKVSNVDLEITQSLIAAHIVLLVAIISLLIHAHATATATTTTTIHALAILPHHVVVLIESTTWSAAHSLRHASLVHILGGSMRGPVQFEGPSCACDLLAIQMGDGLLCDLMIGKLDKTVPNGRPLLLVLN